MKKEEALDLLKRGLQSLLEEETFQRFLEVRAKFRSYSLHNVLMIMVQRPSARLVAGYRKWQEMGRQVRAGERGIAIFAPLLVRVPAKPEPEAEEAEPETEAESEEQAEETLERRLVGFRIVHVWDVEQTEGKPLPEPPEPKLLEGADRDGLFERLAGFAEARGWRVLLEVPMPFPGCNGATFPEERAIRIRPSLPPLQRAKTLCHELGHALLNAEETLPRELEELEAESVAYIVLRCLGIDPGSFSLPYLANWYATPNKLQSRLGRILSAADRILGAISPDKVHKEAA